MMKMQDSSDGNVHLLGLGNKMHSSKIDRTWNSRVWWWI